MGEITGCKVTADHHDNIAGRTKVKDDTVKQKLQPADSVHGMMTNKQQMASLIFCKRKDKNERLLQGKEISARWKERSLPTPMCVLDKCCEDCSWAKENNPDMTFVLDLLHLIGRHQEKLGGCNNQRVRKMFMVDLSRILSDQLFTGAGEEAVCRNRNMVQVKDGNESFDKVLELIEKHVHLITYFFHCIRSCYFYRR